MLDFKLLNDFVPFFFDIIFLSFSSFVTPIGVMIRLFICMVFIYGYQLYYIQLQVFESTSYIISIGLTLELYEFFAAQIEFYMDRSMAV